VIIQTAGAQAAFLAAGGFGLAGAGFGALRLSVRRPRAVVKPRAAQTDGLGHMNVARIRASLLEASSRLRKLQVSNAPSAE
jgi:hypothetical protein